MEVIKRKISFEPATVRYTGGTSPYGTMTADTFYVKVMLTQNSDDMGMFTDISFTGEDVDLSTPDYTILTNKLSLSGYTFPFMSGIQPPTTTNPIDDRFVRLVGDEVSDYWAYAGKLSGETNTKKVGVKSYNKLQNYITGFDVKKTTYTNYVGDVIDGRSRITQLGSTTNTGVETPTTYVFDTNNDVFIGTSNQSTGILYNDYTGGTYTGRVSQVPKNPNALRKVSGFTGPTQYTTVHYNGEGWNETNTSLSALTKEEYLFGITQPPEVLSDVFIDRGNTTVFEKHLRLSEVESLEHLERYNNGFYRTVKQ